MATLWEKKKKRCENTIFQTALDLFMNQGYQQTSIRDIAARSEISLGTIYNYFESKSDILMAILLSHSEVTEQSLQQYLAHIETRQETDAGKSITEFFSLIMETLITYPKPLWRSLLSEAYKDESAMHSRLWQMQNGFFTQTERLVTYLQSVDSIKSNIPPKLVSNTLYQLFFMQYLRFINSDADVSAVLHHLEMHCQLLLNGIGAQ